MRTFRPLSTFRRVILHRVEVRHDTTGEPIPSLAAEMVDGPPSWSIGVVNGDVVVSGPDEDPPTDPQQVVLQVINPANKLFLDTEGDALSLTLVDEVQNHPIKPAAQDIRVNLLDGDRQPVTGETIVIRSATDASATLPTDEDPPGEYRSDLIQFSSDFARFVVVLGGEDVAEGQLMSWQTTTTITAIETT